MRKASTTMVVLTHTVNLFLNLRSPLPLSVDLSGESNGKPHVPHIYERDSNVPVLSVSQAVEKKEDDSDWVDPDSLELRVLSPLGGTCNAFLVEDDQGLQGVFKPTSGEGKHLEDESPLKRGVVYGESTTKEIAAYTLGKNFGVPRTRGVSTTIYGENTYGSLQDFVPHDCPAEDMGPSSFSVDEVQKIGILDIRLLNLDRHLNNLLVVKAANGENQLVPIDHGYCLPSYQDLSDVYLGWTHWKQCKETWTDTSKNAVLGLDPLEDARRLQQLGLSNDSIIAAVFATLLLQHAVQNNINLFQLAGYVQADMLAIDEPSKFEAALKSVISPLDLSGFDFTNGEVPHPKWPEIVESFFRIVDNDWA